LKNEEEVPGSRRKKKMVKGKGKRRLLQRVASFARPVGEQGKQADDASQGDGEEHAEEEDEGGDTATYAAPDTDVYVVFEEIAIQAVEAKLESEKVKEETVETEWNFDDDDIVKSLTPQKSEAGASEEL
jgi:hypothetical protein